MKPDMGPKPIADARKVRCKKKAVLCDNPTRNGLWSYLFRSQESHSYSPATPDSPPPGPH